MTPGAPADGKSDVTVTFDNTHCFGERPADWKPSELHFIVIEEGGKSVIDDIVRAGGCGLAQKRVAGDCQPRCQRSTIVHCGLLLSK